MGHICLPNYQYFCSRGWNEAVLFCRRTFGVGFRQRPYFVEYTRSHPNSEVKRRKARSVLGWGTAREALRVLLAFLTFEFVHRICAIFCETGGAAHSEQDRRWFDWPKHHDVRAEYQERCCRSGRCGRCRLLVLNLQNLSSFCTF